MPMLFPENSEVKQLQIVSDYSTVSAKQCVNGAPLFLPKLCLCLATTVHFVPFPDTSFQMTPPPAIFSYIYFGKASLRKLICLYLRLLKAGSLDYVFGSIPGISSHPYHFCCGFQLDKFTVTQNRSSADHWLSRGINTDLITKELTILGHALTLRSI